MFPFPVCDGYSFDSEIETDADLVLILFPPTRRVGGGSTGPVPASCAEDGEAILGIEDGETPSD